jgi:POT family proton-dependent oligopeptide transporter
MKNLKGLFVFSITNMLERLGFYAMMAILIRSFIEERGFSGEEAGFYYSIFYFAIFLSMFLMGLVGDFVNRRKVIIAGMFAMTIGYFLHSIMSNDNQISIIIPGIFLILGVGAFKTNLLIQVGNLYKENIKNGALGYMIFYTFINLGAIFAPFIAVFFREQFGVNSVFFCGVTLLSLILYYFVPISTEIKEELQAPKEVKTDNIIDSPQQHAVKESPASYGINKLIGLIFLILLVPIFWIAFHQNGLVFTFYVLDYINMSDNSLSIVQTVNPFAFVLFSIIGVIFMYFFVKIKSIYSIFSFIGIGMIIVAIGYYIPAYGISNFSEKLPYSYAIVPMIIISLGELFITPFLTLGFYHYSPASVKGLFMGLFLAVTAIGNMLLFKYAMYYDKYGAVYTFKKIVIHVLICAVAVYLVWFLIKRLSIKKKTEIG